MRNSAVALGWSIFTVAAFTGAVLVAGKIAANAIKGMLASALTGNYAAFVEFYYNPNIFNNIQSLGNWTEPLPNQGSVERNVQGPPAVDAGKQGKYVIGHKNNVAGKSQWQNGQNGDTEIQKGWMNGKTSPDGTKVWDSGKTIGPNGETGVRVHIDGKGYIHGDPVDPKQYLK